MKQIDGENSALSINLESLKDEYMQLHMHMQDPEQKLLKKLNVQVVNAKPKHREHILLQTVLKRKYSLMEQFCVNF